MMKRLLTGYAQQYNRRHRRVGHLFQNRYKSILCEEDPYFLELLRYLHLNPVRAGMAKTIHQLAKYKYSGHAAILGTVNYEWQDREYVLSLFGKTKGRARKQYLTFIADGFNQGHRPELTGGGLLRSYGGWGVIKQHLRQGFRIKGDERILGSSDFVMQVLSAADERLNKNTELEKEGVDFEVVLEKVAEHFGFAPKDICSGSRNRNIAEARAVICFAAVRHLGQSCEEVAGKLQISPSAVCKSVKRGQNIIPETKLIKLYFK